MITTQPGFCHSETHVVHSDIFIFGCRKFPAEWVSVMVRGDAVGAGFPPRFRARTRGSVHSTRPLSIPADAGIKTAFRALGKTQLMCVVPDRTPGTSHHALHFSELLTEVAFLQTGLYWIALP